MVPFIFKHMTVIAENGSSLARPIMLNAGGHDKKMKDRIN
jgi:hypothetical protein